MKLQGKGIEYLVISASLLAMVLLAFFVSKAIAKKKQEQADGLVNTAKSAIIPKNVTLSQTQVNSIADKLFQAMNNKIAYTPSAILDSFNQLNSIDDLYAVIAAFGKRKSTSFFSNFEDNLQGWIQDELRKGWIDEINEILKSKKINFKF